MGNDSQLLNMPAILLCIAAGVGAHFEVDPLQHLLMRFITNSGSLATIKNEEINDKEHLVFAASGF